MNVRTIVAGGLTFVALLALAGMALTRLAGGDEPEPLPEDALPIVLVHGRGGSAEEFESQVLRLTSNGYPTNKVAAYEYDSTFTLTTLPDVHEGLEELIADVRSSAGTDQVDVVGYSLGTFVVQTYLNSSQERAADVAHYANIDGGTGGAVPEAVDTLAVWGEGDSERELVDATNVHLDEQDHREVVGSEETFAEVYSFFTGLDPVTTDVEDEPGEVTLEGRALLRSFNVGIEDATLNVYQLDDEDGERINEDPEASLTLDEDGAWGPFTADAGEDYELVVAGEDGEGDTFRPGPFRRSHHLVRLLVDEPGQELEEAMLDPLATGADYVGVPGADVVASPDGQPYPSGCDGPVPDAGPGTAEWFERDANNLFCSQQRHLDKVSHPWEDLAGEQTTFDPYREPSRGDGVRFRFEETTIDGLDAEVYRPCTDDACTDLPDSLEAFEPPYPAVISFHGGGSQKEAHWWSSQALAEAGYMTIAFDGATLENGEAVLDWLYDSGDELASDFDGELVGVAGHSIGGDAAAGLAHGDSRVSAAVYWDRAGLPTIELDELEVPSLALMGDYGCPQPAQCPFELRPELPDPADRGVKTEDFSDLRDEGMDTMQIAMRAVLHFDWIPHGLSGNPYGELLSNYYTLAWFDRHLKGADDEAIAEDAYERLTAEVFDDSADRHNISQGAYDPVQAAASDDPYGGNVPYTLEGTSVGDRLSFYYESKCYLSVPGASRKAESDDMRADGCD